MKIAAMMIMAVLLVAAPASARYRIRVYEFKDRKLVTTHEMLPTKTATDLPWGFGWWTCTAQIDPDGLAMQLNCSARLGATRLSVGTSALPEIPAHLYLHGSGTMWHITIDFPTRQTPEE